MAVKVTLSLDEATVRRLAQVAARAGKPKSQVVREAIQDYQSRADRRSPGEIERQLAVFDQFTALPPRRSRAAVERELADLRAARRRPGRRHPTP